MTPKLCALDSCDEPAYNGGPLCLKHDVSLMFDVQRNLEGTILPCGHSAISLRGDGRSAWYCEDCRIINERLEYVTRGEL